MESTVESGVQLFSRLAQRSTIKDLNPKLFTDGLSSNQLIEVVSEKNQCVADLLIDFISRSILPRTLNPEWQSSEVILINTEFKISLFQIIKTLRAFLKKRQVQNYGVVIEDSLKNLVILDCFSKEQLVLTMHNLESVVKRRENAALLIFDNVSSFYWVEKMSNKTLSLYGYSRKVLQDLHRFVKDLSLVVVFSRNEKTISQRTLSSIVDYKIILEIMPEEFEFHRLLFVNSNKKSVKNHKWNIVDSIMTFK